LLFLALPFYLHKLLKKNSEKPPIGPRWKEYFGQTPILPSSQQPIWVHAVSVGEVIAITPFVRALHDKTNAPIVVTTTTTTGAAQVDKALGSIVEHRYMPLDLGWAVRRFIKAINPKQLLIVETELWPNTLRAAANASLPVSIVNARLSERSYQRYQKVNSLLSYIVKPITHVICQNQADASRFEKLGFSPDIVHVTGSLKFDITVEANIKEKAVSLKKELGTDRPIWIAASTHSGEEEQILAAHRQVLKSFPNALLLLVPRHPQRFSSVYSLCEEASFNTVRRSSGELPSTNESVYLCDTMGELLVLLAASDICFMAGSLIGDKVGGHNVLEPIALKIPVLNGPSYYNFKDIVESLIAADGIEFCDDQQQLADKICMLFSDEDKRQQLIDGSTQILQQGQGSINRTLLCLTVE
jgi:3-deoxy-D-manno-octulosonic-acid transferase